MNDAFPDRSRNFGRNDAQGPQFLIQHVLAQRTGAFLLLRFQKLADLAAGAARLDISEPGRIGVRVRGGNDLDLITIG